MIRSLAAMTCKLPTKGEKGILAGIIVHTLVQSEKIFQFPWG
jgi:hypothetical protein